jgi:hypothetical protein
LFPKAAAKACSGSIPFWNIRVARENAAAFEK